jgi:hypothetical protein
MLTSLACWLGLVCSFFWNFTEDVDDSAKLTIRKVRRQVLVLYGILCLCETISLWWDPDNLYGTSTVAVMELLFSSFWYLIMAAYFCILSHWIDLYNVAVKALEKQNMLLKIAPNVPPVTVQDILSKATHLKRFKLPFVISTIVILFLSWSYAFLLEQEIIIPPYITLVCYVCVNLVASIITFTFYSKRLTQILPNKVAKNVCILARKLVVLGTFTLGMILLLVLVTVVVGRNTASGYLGTVTAAYLAILLNCWSITSLFFTWRNKPPFIVLGIYRNNSSLSSISTNTQ